MTNISTNIKEEVREKEKPKTNYYNETVFKR